MTDHALTYTGGALDRAGDLRKDPAWIAERLARPDTRILPVWRDLPLTEGARHSPEGPAPATVAGTAAARLLDAASETVFLGLDGEAAVFAADLSEQEEDTAQGLVEQGAFTDLRQTGAWMSATDAALMAFARGILHWHRTHRYCGRSGHATEIHHGGHMRRCTGTECGRETYPRTDPAVIMLVEHRPADGAPRCLLAHHGRLPARAYSTLAGFVEPGESLEEAVAREVFEETGVRVGRVMYQASQPWPFPASIMLGFRARAETTEITLDPDELEDARWFTAEEIAGFGEWEDEGAEVRLSRRDSISRFLLDTWLAEVRS